AFVLGAVTVMIGVWVGTVIGTAVAPPPSVDDEDVALQPRLVRPRAAAAVAGVGVALLAVVLAVPALAHEPSPDAPHDPGTRWVQVQFTGSPDPMSAARLVISGARSSDWMSVFAVPADHSKRNVQLRPGHGTQWVAGIDGRNGGVFET